MPICIYCKDATAGNEPVDHPLPQALGTQSYGLPPGTVCGPCNSYLGGLDANFCDHHHIAQMIVFGALPGSRGRIRSQVSPGFSFDSQRGHLDLRGGRAGFDDGILEVRQEGNRQFDPWEFSRGLHRVALGLLALNDRTDEALLPRYDRVRMYIRRPASRSDFWPYPQRPMDRRLGNRTFPPALVEQGFKAAFAIGNGASYAYLNLFVDEFVVALDGDVLALSADDRQQLALASGLAAERLSRRDWLLFDHARAGRRVDLLDHWRESASGPFASDDDTPSGT